jgi:hypothetical protein
VGRVIYVDGDRGHDETGDGSFGRPFRTVARAASESSRATGCRGQELVHLPPEEDGFAESRRGVRGRRRGPRRGRVARGEWAGTGRRLMVVRDPRERLASACTGSHSRASTGTGDRAARRSGSAGSSPGGRVRRPADREWVTSQRELAAAFRPDEVFRLEDGLAAVLAAVGLDRAHERRANATAGKRAARKPFAETFAPDLPGLAGWLAEDAGEWY